MANQFIVYINLSDVLRESLLKKDSLQYVEVAIDGQTIGRTITSKSFFIANGGHNIHLEYHYQNAYSDGRDHCYYSDFQCLINDDDFEVTVNAYFTTLVEIVSGCVPLDEEKTKSRGGCYVATAVYGSYDCPQVWTLRRYRDYTLSSTWHGRLFIRTYYAISPTLVKWFGDTKWFKKLWKVPLDRKIAKLQSHGVESTPYEDKNW